MMVIEAIIKEDGTLVAKIPKLLWGKNVKIGVQGTELSIEIAQEIMTIIDDLARTTRILAFNATIEAARAGEYGREF